jgi:hypothetical protein
MAAVVVLCTYTALLSRSHVAACTYSGEEFTTFSFHTSKQQGIPKILWSYWDGEIPEFVEKCIQTWRDYNPTYSVRVLTKDDIHAMGIHQYRHAQNDPVRTSDFLRLELLQRYGGIWFDASMMCTAPVDWVQEAYHSIQGGAQLVAFYLVRSTTHPKWPVIENWFLACPAGSPFVTAWNTEFKKINDYEDVGQYLAAVEASGVTMQAIFNPKYLTQHVAAQVVMQKKQSIFSSDWTRKLVLHEAERGPFRYLADGGWDAERAVLLLCSHKDVYMKGYMVKFPNHERTVLIDNPTIAHCVLEGNDS